MISCVQRVSRASVCSDGVTTGVIERGVLILFGVEKGDTENDIDWMANKIANLRIFPDNEGKMSLSLLDTGFSALIVSQFTLAADCAKGRRPDFGNAERPDIAENYYKLFLAAMRAVLGAKKVGAGVFGAHMDVSLVNNGPVTFIIDRGNK